MPPARHQNWNNVWHPKTIEALSKIPVNERGYCGCSPTCSPKKPIKGIDFREHMRIKHFRVTSASPPSSARSAPAKLPSIPALRSPGPSFSPALDSPIELPDDYGHPSDSLGFDPYAADDEDDDSGEEAGMGVNNGVDTPQEIINQPSSNEEGPPIDEGAERDESGTLEEMLQRTTIDRPPTPLQYSPSVSSDPLDRRHSTPIDETIYRLVDAFDSNDLISLWPYSIFKCLFDLPAMGNLPNPYAQTTPSNTSRPILPLLVPLLGHSLAGHFNVPRRAIELVYQISSQVVHLVRIQMFKSFRTWFTYRFPNASPEVLADLDDSLNPEADPAIAPATARAGLKLLDVNQACIVHPVCPNSNCFHIFYDIDSRERISDVPLLCPSCDSNLRGRNGKPTVLQFPRRSLRAELESVFRVPGLEEAIERRRERKDKRDKEDADAQARGVKWRKIFRQQDDGNLWIDEDAEALTLSVNLSIDWASPSRSRSSAADSMGPITLNIASLPAQLRSSFTCTMLMGITPGPKQPKAKNLYKFLLPLCLELRASSHHGFWIPTPAFPHGRRILVHLAAISCDRPAAIDVSGASTFSRRATPCLRCDIHGDDIATKTTGIKRDGAKHTAAVLEQLVTIPRAIAEDKKAWEEERLAYDAARTARNRAKRLGEPVGPPPTRVANHYTNDRRDAVTLANTLVHGNPTALAVIHGFDKTARTVFDPMHAVLEGALKTYVYRVITMGDHQRFEVEEGGSQTEVGSDTAVDRHIDQAENIISRLGTGDTEVNHSTIAELRTFVEGLRERPGRAKRLKMMPADVLYHQQLIQKTVLPSSVSKLHPLWGSASAGTPTASDWRVFGTIIGPLTIPLLFCERGSVLPDPSHTPNKHLSQEELESLMTLFEIVTLAFRSSISDIQIDMIEQKVNEWSSNAYRLHPRLSKSTNIHILQHLGEDIRNFGPIYGWWSFLVERINFIAKSTNRSGGSKDQAQVVTMRAILRARAVVSTRMKALGNTEQMTEDERTVVNEIISIFDGLTRDPATNAFESVAFRYDELERSFIDDVKRYTTGISSVRSRGATRTYMLDDLLKNRLQDCLASSNILATLIPGQRGPSGQVLPFLVSSATFWEGVTFDTRRFDCAEWGRQLLKDRLGGLDASKLVLQPNCLFEVRPEDVLLGGQDQRRTTGVLCALFEHASPTTDGSLEKSLYAVLRLLVPYGGTDPYGYRKNPALNVWLWKADELGPLRIAKMSADAFRGMASVALISLPASPGQKDDPLRVWATIPVHHH